MDNETAIVVVIALAIVAYGYVSHEMAIGAAKEKAANQWSLLAKLTAGIIGA